MEREVGGGIGMGNTCKPMAVSFQCMTKFTTNNKKKKEKKITQSYPTLCDPMNYTVHVILQARILEWVASPLFRGSSQPRDQTQVSLIAGESFTRFH